MKPLLRSNLLVQFSAISFVLLVAIAVAISMVLTTTLSRDIDLLRVHGKAMTSGIAIEDTDDHSIQNLVGDAKALRWVIYASVAISFVMLYGLLIMTVWLGWNTMSRRLQSLNSELERQVRQLDAEVDVRKETEASLAHHTAALEEANRELTELQVRRDAFVSIASHELRTPTTTVMGYSDLLLQREPPENVRRQWVEHINKESHRLTMVLDDLLDVSRIQSGKLTANQEPVDIKAIAERVVVVMRPTGEGHEFAIEGSLDMQYAIADEDKLTQVLTNLVSNAVKYSPTGGMVTISLQHDPGQGVILVSVSDQGIGILPEDQADLFATSNRIRRPETEAIGGTGLGLYIVRELAGC